MYKGLGMISNQKQFCKSVLHNCDIKNKFESWTVPASGTFVQDPAGAGRVTLDIDSKRSWKALVSKKRLVTAGEGVVEKWLVCVAPADVAEKDRLETCCVQKKSDPDSDATDADKATAAARLRAF